MKTKKYDFTGNTCAYGEVILHQIIALKDLSYQYGYDGHLVKIPSGTVGGWIEKEENLSQDGKCWVDGNAYVFGNAQVLDNAVIMDNAKVFGNAKVFDNSQVFDNAKVYSNAQVYGDAWVFGDAYIADNAMVYGNAKVYYDAIVWSNAKIYGNATIKGNARVSDNAEVHDFAFVYENAKIYGNSKVYGTARLHGNVELNGDAIVCQEMTINNNSVVTVDLTDRKNLANSIVAQCGLLPINGKVTCFKQVNDDLTSFHDKNFQYKVGEWASVDESEITRTDVSCGVGLHFSSADYWNNNVCGEQTTYLVAEIDLDDIISVQNGKIRCKRAFITNAVILKHSSRV